MYDKDNIIITSFASFQNKAMTRCVKRLSNYVLIADVGLEFANGLFYASIDCDRLISCL